MSWASWLRSCSIGSTQATALIELTTSSGDPLGLQDLSGLGAELNQGEQMNSDLLTQLTVINERHDTAGSVVQRLQPARTAGPLRFRQR